MSIWIYFNWDSEKKVKDLHESVSRCFEQLGPIWLVENKFKRHLQRDLGTTVDSRYLELAYLE